MSYRLLKCVNIFGLYCYVNQLFGFYNKHFFLHDGWMFMLSFKELDLKIPIFTNCDISLQHDRFKRHIETRFFLFKQTNLVRVLYSNEQSHQLVNVHSGASRILACFVASVGVDLTR